MDSPGSPSKRKRSTTPPPTTQPLPTGASSSHGLLTPPDTNKKQLVDTTVVDITPIPFSLNKSPAASPRSGSSTPTTSQDDPREELGDGETAHTGGQGTTDVQPATGKEIPTNSEVANSDTPKDHYDGLYRFDCGRYKGLKPTSVAIAGDYGYLMDMLDMEEATKTNDKTASTPIRDALAEWAANYPLGFGNRYPHQPLKEVPIFYINTFVLNNGRRELRDIGLRLALRCHLPREEIPGSRYKLTFGKYKGKTLREVRNLEQQNPHPVATYIEWLKGEGLPERDDNYQDLAEALVFFEKENVEQFELDNPGIETYHLPNEDRFKQYRGWPIQEVPWYYIVELRDNGIEDEADQFGAPKYPELATALEYHDKIRATVMWNWRMQGWFAPHERLGRIWESYHPGLQGLLYPSSTRSVTTPEEDGW